MTIGEFFLKLATDSEFLERYKRDADSALRETELSEAQRALLLAGDLRGVRLKIVAEFDVEGDHVAFGTVHTITVHAPKPPPPKD